MILFYSFLVLSIACCLHKSFLQEHPAAVSYRDKFFGSYSELCKIFEDEVLAGAPSGQVLGVETDHTAPEVILDRECGNLETPGGDIHLSDQQRKRSTGTPDLGRASKAQKTDQEMQKMLFKMAGIVTRLASPKGNKNYSTIESAVDALQALPDIDDELSVGSSLVIAAFAVFQF